MNSLIYGNAAIKARENTSLLTRDKLIRLMDAESTADAVKILTESGYGGGLVLNRAEDYLELLSKEEQVYLDYVKSVAPANCGIESMLIDKDYLNLKVLLKNKLFDARANLASGGFFDLEELKSLVETGESDTLPAVMTSAVNSILARESVAPAEIDVTLDKAYFIDVYTRAKKSHSAILKDYFVLKADGTNVLTYLRAKKAGLNEAKLNSLLVDGGNIAPKLLAEAYANDSLSELIKDYSIREIVEANSQSVVAFEKALDDSLIAMLSTKKDDMFSLAPLAYYVVAKGLELKTVGVILTGIQNNAPKSAISERVRVIYA